MVIEGSQFPSKSNFSIRNAELADANNILEWRNDIHTRLMSRTSNLVKWEKHISWFCNSLKNPEKYIYILEINKMPIGMCRFELIQKKKNEYEISVNLSSEFRGKNLGEVLLRLSIEKFNKDICGQKTISAEIKNKNRGNLDLFTKYGFNHVGLNNKFKRYIYEIN